MEIVAGGPGRPPPPRILRGCRFARFAGTVASHAPLFHLALFAEITRQDERAKADALAIACSRLRQQITIDAVIPFTTMLTARRFQIYHRTFGSAGRAGRLSTFPSRCKPQRVDGGIFAMV